MTSSKERRLLAVMFTDVVGYTALMQRDEEAARIVRRRHREVLEAPVSANGGDLLQYLGDGSLTMFPSVGDAVRAAIEVQRGLRQEPVVPLRIGIHQGDISYDTQGAYGDSVNIASRIQSLGTAGGILLSAKAHDEIKNQPDITTTPLGEFELKNVEGSLEVYGIVSDVLAVPTRSDLLKQIRLRPATESDAIIRLNTTLQGRYRIQRELGQGGMATVYLADDLRHERKVALKVLKPELAAVVGAERFLAEIKTTANLQHPHILPLFDSGEADAYVFYVMPYVEGESLREKLNREHQLPVDEAVRIASEVADALQAAHEQDVVHRDIKPANILLSRGSPLVADFGIALAVGVAGGDRLTETGLSLGTPHYMSPEQATGDQTVGPPTDIYALGCVLYEMLVGEPPYTGSTPQAVLGKIIAGKPVSVMEERPSVPANLDAAIRKSLEKLPADRFTSALGFTQALVDPGYRHGELVGAGVAAGTAPLKRLTVGFAGFAVLLGLVAAWGWLRPPPITEPGHATRSIIDLGDISVGIRDEIIVSPDGSRFAVTGVVDGQRSLFWRDAAEEHFRVIPGTGNAFTAAFSPDGDWIVYATQGGNGLLKVSLSGGAPTPVVAPGDVSPFHPHWGDDGTIVFSDPYGIYRVPDTGGEPVRLLREARFTSPSLLPGGRAVIGALYDAGGIMLLDLETDSLRELIPGGSDPQYVETGHLLYTVASGGLWAVAFDVNCGEVLGGAVPIFDGLSVFSFGPSGLLARYSVSRNGTLVYGVGGGGGYSRAQQRLLVVDLQGNEESTPLDPREFASARWSPDGETVVYAGTEPGGASGRLDIYTYNVALRTAPKRITFEGFNVQPVWSPDGTRVAFASQRDGTDGFFGLFVKTVNDDSPPQMIVILQGGQYPTQWPSDDLVIFDSGGPSDLWMVDLSSDSAIASPYLEMEAAISGMRVSPGGDLAAYTSNESGTRDVYVRSFPEARQPEIVSQGGGDTPLWSPDGNTIYYWTLGGRIAVKSLIAARIERGPPFVVTSRDTVLAGTYLSWGSDLHPDGDRLIIAQNVSVAGANTAADEAPEPERFLVVVNWFEELLERMGN